MGSLGVVELVPLLIAQFLGVPTAAHIGVAALIDLFVEGFAVGLSEVFLHELLGECFRSCSSREDESEEDDLETGEDGDYEDVAVGVGQGEGHCCGGCCKVDRGVHCMSVAINLMMMLLVDIFMRSDKVKVKSNPN